MPKFPKCVRVVHQRDFDRVFKQGKVQADGVLVIHAILRPEVPTRLGLSISKRVGNAVVRNRWKRLIREAFRLQYASLPTGLDLVVRPKKGATPSLPAIRESLAKLLPGLRDNLCFAIPPETPRMLPKVIEADSSGLDFTIHEAGFTLYVRIFFPSSFIFPPR